MNPEAIEMLAELRKLGVEKAKLLTKLERSLAIQQLWPEVFDHGECSSSWVGAPLGRRLGKDLRWNMLYDLRLQIHAGNGEEREFPQDDVPPVLWPHPEKGRYS